MNSDGVTWHDTLRKLQSNYVVECKQFMNGKSNSFINYANQELLVKVSTTISDRVSRVELINIKLFECGSLYSIVFITLMLPFDVKTYSRLYLLVLSTKLRSAKNHH